MKQFYKSIPLSENKTDLLVKSELISLGYCENLELKRYLSDNNKISYYVFYTIYYHGEEAKVLSRLSCRDYMKYLKSAFEKLDNEIHSIYPNVEREKVYYYISACPKSKGKVYKKGR